ncbi:MAG: glutaredoxin family protein [Candidatus Paceibacterota bacterium]
MAENTQSVEIYTTPTCHFCKAAKAFFKENDIEYAEYNVAEDADKRKEMVEKTGQIGVPVIIIDGETLVGFDEGKVKEKLGV